MFYESSAVIRLDKDLGLGMLAVVVDENLLADTEHVVDIIN